MAVPPAPADLTVDDRTAPLGVEGVPLFGWRPGERQTAYQIRVPGVWDSGKIASACTAFVPYEGPIPRVESAYRWAVRTWDGDDRPSPWAASTFDTGVGEWAASWIRRTTAEEDDYTLARIEFTLAESPVVRARLYLSAAQQYRAYVNGGLVDRG